MMEGHESHHPIKTVSDPSFDFPESFGGSIDPGYMTAYDFPTKEGDSFEENTGLGLLYRKPGNDIFEVPMYRYSMPLDDFASAPAAFGVYNDNVHSPSQYYNESGQAEFHAVPADHLTSPTMYYDFGMFPLAYGESMPIEWSSSSNMLSDYASKSNHSEFDDHVNPASIEVSFGNLTESGQTIAQSSRQTSPYQQTRKRYLPRAAAQSINIDEEGIDRKTLKRLRNRVSASRCRIKKKEWLSEMEELSIQLQEENSALAKEISVLEENIEKSRKYLAFCKKEFQWVD